MIQQTFHVHNDNLGRRCDSNYVDSVNFEAMEQSYYREHVQPCQSGMVSGCGESNNIFHALSMITIMVTFATLFDN